MPPIQPAPVRNEFWDYLRGWLIILVVWGHAIQHLAYRNNLFWADPVFKLIYSFHMPLFMAVSGYLAYGAARHHGFAAGISRRFQQIIVPLVSWCLLYRILLLAGFWITLGTLSESGGIATFFGDLAGEIWIRFWFLWAVFFSAVVGLLLKRLRLDQPLPCMIAAAGGLLIPDAGNFSLIKNIFPFFFIGYALAQAPAEVWARARRPLWLALGLIGTALVWLAWRPQHHVYLSGASSNWEHLPILAFRFAAAVTVSITFVLLVSRWYQPGNFPMLAQLGQRSLGIYILQDYLFTGLRWNFYSIEPRFLAWVVALPAALILCLGLSQLIGALAHSPAASRWLLGRIPARPA